MNGLAAATRVPPAAKVIVLVTPAWEFHKTHATTAPDTAARVVAQSRRCGRAVSGATRGANSLWAIFAFVEMMCSDTSDTTPNGFVRVEHRVSSCVCFLQWQLDSRCMHVVSAYMILMVLIGAQLEKIGYDVA